ncbi:Transcriptional regulator, MarR family [Fulvivirga imtechensis AK7]|uniref:Transcriptional regulator, MarR family n=1 Tax=Fulvivirga imtechensis AK7 TaxID=1237149 RepID=L8JGR5_9BACT|nr:MarR family winged helix-turn-helix transcriptional regulator [Fulvivirga imtechensis]ELR68010.1 Transcriptional regulator, MarR family [Fulvivirga imtechensis AK7]
MNIFDPLDQNIKKDVKIVAALERISHAFKVLQLREGKDRQLSPIQIQIMFFIQFHAAELCTVSHLAREFDLTKATVSDAVRVLLQKGLVEKTMDSTDSRSYYIKPTVEGQREINNMKDFGMPVLKSLKGLSTDEKNNLLNALFEIIRHLNKAGVISVQRICHNCAFYEKKEGQHFCNLLKSGLADADIRMDCPEFVAGN